MEGNQILTVTKVTEVDRTRAWRAYVVAQNPKDKSSCMLVCAWAMLGDFVSRASDVVVVRGPAGT